MKNSIFSIVVVLVLFSCHSKNTIKTNKIYHIDTKPKWQYGVKSKSGEELIPALYTNIRKIQINDKNILPVQKRNYYAPLIEYYLVIDKTKKAIFDANGKIIFDFIEATKLVFDENTKTVIVTNKQPDNRYRSFLYDLNHKLLDESYYKKIGYINNSHLIALVAENGKRNVKYLYNSITKKKFGPYEHYNVYDESYGTNIGKALDANPTVITKAKVVSIRDSDYNWGLLDFEGNEILPMEFAYFKVMDTRGREELEKADKPKNVKLVFNASHKSTHKIILFDEDFNKYEYKRVDGKGVIKKIDKI